MGGTQTFITDIHGEYRTFQRIADGLCGPVGSLYVLGDIYDRGPSPDLVMDALAATEDLHIVWGNHDILWMGASLGQRGSVANAVRICARYGNLSILEETYGMDLGPLRDFAASTYADDPCTAFGLKGSPELTPREAEVTVKVQKAMALIQFKVEAALIDENPSFGLDGRRLLHKVDPQAGTVELDGKVYELEDKLFPTQDWEHPYRLSAEEEAVMEHLVAAFTGCERLQRHMRLLLEKGSLYTRTQGKLLFHACVPLEADGSLKEVELYGRRYSGRALFDAVDSYVRAAYNANDPLERKRGADLLWYLWLGEGSPLFAKSKMATFELYYIAEKEARTEVKNPFYTLWENQAAMDGVLADFQMPVDSSRILCGHVPVKVKDGEDPVKCGGKVVDLDGGMSRPYQKNTGVGGFVLVSDGEGDRLATIAPTAGDEYAVQSWRTL